MSYNTSIVHINERSVDFTDLDVSLNSRTSHENITFMCKSRVPATLGVNKGISNYKESSQNKRTVLSESELNRDSRGCSGTPLEVFRFLCAYFVSKQWMTSFQIFWTSGALIKMYEKVSKVSKFYIFNMNKWSSDL